MADEATNVEPSQDSGKRPWWGGNLAARNRILTKNVLGTVNFAQDLINPFFDFEEDKFKPVNVEDIHGSIVDISKAYLRGNGKLSEDIVVGDFLADRAESLLKPSESWKVEMGEDIGAFMIGFVGSRNLLQGAAKLTKETAEEIAKKTIKERAKTYVTKTLPLDIVASGVTSGVLLDPEANRAANWIPEPRRNDFFQYLAQTGDETRLEGRFKNVLEDMILGIPAGIAVDGVVTGLAATFKRYKGNLHSATGSDPEDVALALRDELGLEGIIEEADQLLPARRVTEGVSLPEANMSPVSDDMFALADLEFQALARGGTEGTEGSIDNAILKEANNYLDPEPLPPVNPEDYAIPLSRSAGQADTALDVTLDLSEAAMVASKRAQQFATPTQFKEILETILSPFSVKELGIRESLTRVLNTVAFDFTDADSVKRIMGIVQDVTSKNLKKLNATTLKEMASHADALEQKALSKEVEEIADMFQVGAEAIEDQIPTLILAKRMLGDVYNQMDEAKTLYYSATKPEDILKHGDEFIKLLQTSFVILEPAHKIIGATGKALAANRVHGLKFLREATKAFKRTKKRPAGTKPKAGEVIRRADGADVADAKVRKKKEIPDNITESTIRDYTVDKVKRLRSRLAELQGRFGNDDALDALDPKEASEVTEEMADLANRIKFYTRAEREAKRITTLQSQVDELEKAMLTGNEMTMTEAVQSSSKYNLKAPMSPRLKGLKDEIKALKAVIRVRLHKNVDKVMDRLQKQLSKHRLRFGDDATLDAMIEAKARKARPLSPAQQAVREKIAFYKQAEREAMEALATPKAARQHLTVAQKAVKNLESQLARHRKQFAKDAVLKNQSPKQIRAITEAERSLTDRLSFYKTAVREANKANELTKKIAEARASLTKDTVGGLEDLTGISAARKARKAKEIKAAQVTANQELKALEAELKALKAVGRKRLKELTKVDKAQKLATASERLDALMSADDPQALLKAAKDATADDLVRLLDTLRNVDMKDHKALVKNYMDKNAAKGPLDRLVEFIQGVGLRHMLMGTKTLAIQPISAVLVNSIKSFEDVIGAMLPVSGKGQLRMARNWNIIGNMWRDADGIIRQHAHAMKLGREQGKSTAEILESLRINRTTFEGVNVGGGGSGIELSSPNFSAQLWNKYARTIDNLSYGAIHHLDGSMEQFTFATEAGKTAHALGFDQGLRGDKLHEFEKTMVEHAFFLARNKQEGIAHLWAQMEAQGVSKGQFERHILAVGEVVSDAKASALNTSFKDEIDGAILKGLEGMLRGDSLSQRVAKFMVMPFSHTFTKMTEFSIERTPFALLTKKFHADFSGINGAKAKQRAIAKQVTGTMLFTAGYLLADNNIIVGKFRDPAERDAMEAIGIKEFSVNLGGISIPYKRAEPLGSFLGIAADMNRVKRLPEDQQKEWFEKFYLSIWDNAMASSFLASASEILDIAQGDRGWERYTAGKIKAIVAPMGALQRTFRDVLVEHEAYYKKYRTDPKFKELETWLDVTLGDTGLTDDRLALDQLGNPVAGSSTLGSLLGFPKSKISKSPALRQFARMKRFPSNSDLSLDTGFKMTKDETQRMREIMGGELNLTSRLDALVETPKYKRMNDEGKYNLMMQVVNHARKMAKALMMQEDPELSKKLVKFNEMKIDESLKTFEGDVSIEDVLQSTSRQVKRKE